MFYTYWGLTPLISILSRNRDPAWVISWKPLDGTLRSFSRNVIEKIEQDAIVPVSTYECLICISKLIVQRNAIEKDDKENDT